MIYFNHSVSSLSTWMPKDRLLQEVAPKDKKISLIALLILSCCAVIVAGYLWWSSRKVLSSKNAIEEINSGNLKFKDLGLNTIEQILEFAKNANTKLEILDLRDVKTYIPNGEVKKIIEACPNIKTLALRICNKSDLESLSKLKHLTHLTFTGYFISDADPELSCLTSLNSLTSLCLDNCTALTDVGLKNLPALTELQCLMINKNVHITDFGLQNLSSLQNLRSLALGDCVNVTEVGLKSVSELSKLTYLDIHQCIQVTDAGLEPLAALKNLTTLNVKGCKRITNDGLLPFPSTVQIIK